MKNVNRFFQMLARLGVFAKTYPKFFAKDTLAGQSMAEVEAAHEKYLSLAASVRGGDAAIKLSASDKAGTQEELVGLMETVCRLAKGLGATQFCMPREKGLAANLSVARMWTEAEPLRQKFQEAGLTEFLEQLAALVSKMSQTIDLQTLSRGSRVQATETIKQTRLEALAALKRLDPLMRHLLRGDAPVLAVWQRWRHVERLPVTKPAEVVAPKPEHEPSPPEPAAAVAAEGVAQQPEQQASPAESAVSAAAAAEPPEPATSAAA